MIYITKFRSNDLNPSKGKQIEFNKGVAEDFFGFHDDSATILFNCLSLTDKQVNKSIVAHLKLSKSRGDYKIYQNEDGTPDLKDFFINTLGLTPEDNSEDFYAIKKINDTKFDLYYIPKESLFTDFISAIGKDPYVYFEKPQDNEAAFKYVDNEDIIAALKTKPFLLLAGISGTGKSRKVQELAYATCPRDGQLDADPTYPGNYCLIEVKPNWHDSTELLGYYSNISGKYMLTNFIRFVYKTTQHPGIPFFVCLDEMNLAPVEQYFAEYLSVLETRKRILNELNGKYEIRSAELISKKSFENIKIESDHRSPVDSFGDDVPQKGKLLYTGEDLDVIRYIKENGLRLPENLFVIGTVNMDDTTHQFSRKVIDRAFTIEMNGGRLESIFDAKDTLTYSDSPLDGNLIIPSFTKAQDVIEAFPDDADTIKIEVPKLLDEVNGKGIFQDTPFRVSYRVENELIIYIGSLRMTDRDSDVKVLINQAFLTILLEKILPRVEGDEKTMHCGSDGNSEILMNLQTLITKVLTSAPYPHIAVLHATVSHKLQEMNERVKTSYFTSFFS